MVIPCSEGCKIFYILFICCSNVGLIKNQSWNYEAHQSPEKLHEILGLIKSNDLEWDSFQSSFCAKSIWIAKLG